jgi:hypothetical protein
MCVYPVGGHLARDRKCPQVITSRTEVLASRVGIRGCPLWCHPSTYFNARQPLASVSKGMAEKTIHHTVSRLYLVNQVAAL